MAKFNYSKALIRLEEISESLAAEVQDIDVLTDLVKESASLLKQCKQQLKNTAKEIEDTLDGIDKPLT